MTTYTELAIQNESGLVFGQAPRPVECGFDLRIGAGQVFPEVNFTLPALEVSQTNWSQVIGHYEEIARDVVRRVVALRVPGVVLEFEHPVTQPGEFGGGDGIGAHGWRGAPFRHVEHYAGDL